MPPFLRKKATKSFPVKVCTLDAELEFNLEVKQYLCTKYINIVVLFCMVKTVLYTLIPYKCESRGSEANVLTR